MFLGMYYRLFKKQIAYLGVYNFKNVGATRPIGSIKWMDARIYKNIQGIFSPQI